jgi:hypothetical protein
MSAATTIESGESRGKGSTMDFSTIPHGCLIEGTETSKGVIEQVSFTAYLIAGEWVPFTHIHGAYASVMPLVVLG